MHGVAHARNNCGSCMAFGRILTQKVDLSQMLIILASLRIKVSRTTAPLYHLYLYPLPPHATHTLSVAGDWKTNKALFYSYHK